MEKLEVEDVEDVYLAQSQGDDKAPQRIEIKRIFLDQVEKGEFARVLLNNAKLALTLKHPNILQILEVSTLEGHCHVAVEFVNRINLRTLRQILEKKKERLPTEQTLHIIASLAAGLHHVHQWSASEAMPNGVVHRNITPSNVLLTPEGNVKLTLFGKAPITIEQNLSYVSPEQCTGKKIDYKSDIYSLGIILYELYTGRSPYTQTESTALKKEIIEGKIIVPSTFQKVPRMMEQVILKCLAKDPAKRFDTALDIQEGIEFFVQQSQINSSDRSLATFLKAYTFALPQPTKIKGKKRKKENSNAAPAAATQKIPTVVETPSYAQTLPKRPLPPKKARSRPEKKTKKSGYEQPRITQELPLDILEQLKIEQLATKTNNKPRGKKKRAGTKDTALGLQSVNVNLVRRQEPQSKTATAEFEIDDLPMDVGEELPFENGPPTEVDACNLPTVEDTEGVIGNLIKKFDQEN